MRKSSVSLPPDPSSSLTPSLPPPLPHSLPPSPPPYLCLCADCFGIYDLNNDGYISREEMFQMLKSTVQPTGEEELDDYIKDLVEITIKMMVSGMAV